MEPEDFIGEKSVFQEYETIFKVISDVFDFKDQNKPNIEIAKEVKLIKFLKIIIIGVIYNDVYQKSLNKKLAPHDIVSVVLNIKHQHTIDDKIASLITGNWDEYAKVDCDCPVCSVFDRLNRCAEFKMVCRKIASLYVYESPQKRWDEDE